MPGNQANLTESERRWKDDLVITESQFPEVAGRPVCTACYSQMQVSIKGPPLRPLYLRFDPCRP
jgi:hypothetical protein